MVYFVSSRENVYSSYYLAELAWSLSLSSFALLDFKKLQYIHADVSRNEYFYLQLYLKISTTYFWKWEICNHYFLNYQILIILIPSIQFSSVQSLNGVQLFVTPWTAAHQDSLSISNSWSPPKPMFWSQWCHPTISSSVLPVSCCPQSFPASGSFQMSQLFTSGGQSIGVSASTSVLPFIP